MPFTNNNGQSRVGVRISPLVSQVTASTLWNSIYSVYNADSVGSSSLKTSLVASYNGELNTNDSYGSNNGSAVGGLTYSTGKIGNAFQFNGTNAYVSLPTDSWNNTIGGDFSVSVWVNLTNVSSQQNIIGNLSTLNAGWNGWEIRVLSGIPRFNLYRYGAASLISSTTIVANTWYHIVITRKAGVSMNIYVNGSKTTANTITNDPVINATHYPVIGALQYDASKFYYLTSGSKVDGVNIWNRELSESEVVDLYNSDNGSQYIGNDFYKPTTSDAVYLNNGTVVGGLTYIPGKVGTAFQFNGTNAYVDLPNNSLNLTGDFSISLWYYTTVISGEKYIVSNYIRPTVGSGFILLQSSNRIGINIYGTSQINLYTNVNTIDANTWYHVTVTRKSGTRTRVYLNGVLSASNTSIVDPIYPEPSYPTAIGAAPGYGGYVNGRIDALNIWNRELTESDVTELYNSGDGVQYSNPLSPLLLDSYYGAAAAYSLRKLKNSWTGSAIKVRRSSDNLEQNIGFDVNGNLDTASLLSFVGAGSGFVSVWFDQSGNGRNLIQNTSVNQPWIVNSGVLYTLNDKPSVYHSELNIAKFLKVSFGSTSTGAMTAINVGSNQGTAGGSYLWSGESSPLYAYSYNTTWMRIGASAEFALTGTTQNLSTQRIINAIYNGASSKLRFNNGTYATGNTGTVSITGLTLGASSLNSSPSRCHHQEFIVWNSNKLIDMDSINVNLNSYYTTY